MEGRAGNAKAEAVNVQMEMLFKILTKLVWSEYESIRTNARLAKRHGRTAPCRHSTGPACAGTG